MPYTYEIHMDEMQWNTYDLYMIECPSGGKFAMQNTLDACNFAFRIVWKSCSENIRAVHELSNFSKDPEFAVIVKIGLWPR